MLRSALILLTATTCITGLGPSSHAATNDSRLAVVHIQTDSNPANNDALLRVLIANEGTEPTRTPFSVLLILPAGTRTSHSSSPFPTNCCAGPPPTAVVTCSFPAGLMPLRTAVVLLPIHFDSDVPGGSVLSGGSVAISSEGQSGSDVSVAFSETVPCRGARPAGGSSPTAL